MLKVNKKFGLTIAEVLLAIAIIGVLSLLLTSVFKSNANSAWLKNKDYKLGIVKYDKVYNAINYSFNQQLMKNNDISNLGTILDNALNTLNANCTGNACNIAAVNGQEHGYNIIDNQSRKLADGPELTVYSKTTDGSTEYIVYVDTNGNSEPNRIGRDILPIYIDKDGNLINVNPKTGRKYEKLAKKTYASKKYKVKCPKEDKEVYMIKNVKTGLYESFADKDGKTPAKCSKICDIDYAQKAFINTLSKDPYGLEGDLSKINVTDGNTFLYPAEGATYKTIYSPQNCFGEITEACPISKAIKNFKSSKGWGNKVSKCTEGKNIIVDNANTSISCKPDYIEYKITYDIEDCSIKSRTPFCSKDDAKLDFLNRINKQLRKTLTQDMITETDNLFEILPGDGYKYSATYNSKTCLDRNPSKKSATCYTKFQELFNQASVTGDSLFLVAKSLYSYSSAYSSSSTIGCGWYRVRSTVYDYYINNSTRWNNIVSTVGLNSIYDEIVQLEEKCNCKLLDKIKQYNKYQLRYQETSSQSDGMFIWKHYYPNSAVDNWLIEGCIDKNMVNPSYSYLYNKEQEIQNIINSLDNETSIDNE